MWTCPLVFCGLKSLPKKCLFLQQQYSGHFSFMPCQPACSCMIADHESHLLPPRIKPCGEMLLAFDFPPDPPLYALASGFPAVPAFLFDAANPSICMAFLSVSFLQVCIGSLVPPAGGVGCRPPTTLRLLRYTWLFRCTPSQKRLQHHNPSFSVLRTFCLASSCSSQAARPSQ